MKKKKFVSKLLLLILVGVFFVYSPTTKLTDSSSHSTVQICSDFECEPIKEN